MINEFCRYFFRYIVFAKTRQRLLFLAIGGLFISSFALLILQSTMNGLQDKLMSRSKQVLGEGVLFLDDLTLKEAEKLMEELKAKDLSPIPEFEQELLLRHKNYITPVIAHGLDPAHLPGFLKNISLKEVVLGKDLAISIHADDGNSLQITTPTSVDSLLGDIPRTSTLQIDATVGTDVPDVDLYHLWIRLPILQNLLKQRNINRIRLYRSPDKDTLQEWLSLQYKNKIRFKSWEDQHQTLVWALQMETAMMLFLFVGMTMLVSLCITSGLLIFFDKIKNDLASFWILGSSKKQLQKAFLIFLSLLSLASVVLGLITGGIFLFLLHRYGIEIMPDVFVDRKIPILITPMGIIISFIVPYTISLTFSFFSLNQFKRESSYLSLVRTVG